MTHQPPYLYSAPAANDSRFPASTFDPKAITRASWEPRPERKSQAGPLLSFNTHPDAHDVLRRPSKFNNLGAKSKSAIKWVRRLQLFLRVLELNGALGILVFLVLIIGINVVTAWTMRACAALASLHTLYASFHHARSPTARTPGSTAAYQLFSSVVDIMIASVYAYGAFSTQRYSKEWSTLLSNQDLLEFMIPAIYYIIIGSGALHMISFIVSIWLAITFQRISDMPPDMNPLESHLTARPSLYKRQNASEATYVAKTEKRLSTAHSSKQLSEASWQSFSYPRTVPFMHTRKQSQDTLANSEIHLDPPQTKCLSGSSNAGFRSFASISSSHRPASRYSRGSYAEIALGDASPDQPRYVANDGSNGSGNTRRTPKFIETWAPTDSLISRTRNRNRKIAASHAPPLSFDPQSYAALVGRDDDDYESDHGNKEGVDEASQKYKHPNPLRSHLVTAPPSPSSPPCSEKYGRGSGPASPVTPPSHPNSPWTASRLSAKSALSDIGSQERLNRTARSPWTNRPDLRPPPPPSLIDEQGHAISVEKLRATAPFAAVGETRKISSGNDYHALAVATERRRVSGKVAEEGLAYGDRFTIGYAR